MWKGKLVTFEGGDGSGKGTQARLMVEALEKVTKVTMFDFPQYETFFGSLVGRALRGDYGDFVGLAPELSALPYMLDRLLVKEKIEKALEEGVVVCNRYVPSNIGFNAAKAGLEREREVVEFIEQAEYEKLKLPKTDVMIYLHVPREVSAGLIKGRDQKAYMKSKKDQYEKDTDLQDKVVDFYLRMARFKPNWYSVSCLENGKIMTPEEIHQKVYKIVEQKFSE